MPPFSAPIPEDEPPELPKGRRPYSSPTAEPEAEPRRRPRRIVNHPDKLVAGSPRPEPESRPEPEAARLEAETASSQEPAPEERPAPPQRDARTAPYHLAFPAEARIGADRPREEAPEQQDEPEPRDELERWGDAPERREESFEEQQEEPPQQQDEEPSGEDVPAVRRVGRPPAGRPTRPDLLVATGQPRPQGSSGRHHRGPAPAAVRRSSPVRRGNRAVPVAVTLAVALLVTAGVIVWQWSGDEAPGLRLEAGTGRSGDELFTVPAAGDGTNQKLNDMTSVGRAVVAVGSDTTSPTPRPLFLFSPDGGKNWQLGQVSGASTPTVQRVVGGAGRWLASGDDVLSGERGLWTSTDGFSWTAVAESGLAAFRAGDQIHDIARTASGFVAVGRTTGDDGGSGPAAWRSGDGRTWERVETRGLEVREIMAVVAKGDTVVAIGQPAEGEGSRVLRSADGGRNWQATGFQLPEAMPRTGTVAVLPKRFVLVPTRQRTVAGDVRVYCSPTGAQWAQCGTIGGLSGESPGVESLISYPSGVAAITQAGLGKYAVLTTTDGRGWAKRADLGNLQGATLRGFTISDGGTLFAGGDQAASDVDNQLVLMTAPRRGAASRVQLAQVEGLTRVARETTALAGFGGRYVAVGSASGDAGLWTIRNWQSWKSMSLGGPGRQTLEDVTHGSRGWLAVGGTETNVGVTDPLLVTSDDGESWKKVNVTGDLARDADHTALETRVVTAGKPGYVLAGESRDQSGSASAAMWFTPDLRKFTRSAKLPQGGSGVRIYDAIASGDGYVAVGGSGPADQESSVVWHSDDGVNWSSRKRVAPPDATSAGLRRVTTYQDKLVAIGTALAGGARRAFAAVSDDDGTTWQTAWLPADQAAAVYDLAAAEEGLVAVGWHGVPGEGDSAAWTSQDGLSWNRMALTKDRLAGQGMQSLTAVAVSGSEVVALGRSTTYNADHLILWTSSLTSNR
ncbi:WD40/YVTN/BNR-like repeat-containing protein [Nonomuraea sp. M3C6]|uniref:WD40/YVTN/BNR-like repeat-containing protein n=1 Tax=Nonomuraea marmarensis TaxID=3351344 RepID=A0ABW7AC12_9ACTN